MYTFLDNMFKVLKVAANNEQQKDLAASYLEKTVNDNMTKEKLQKLYEQYVRDNPPQEGMTASHILVKTDAERAHLMAHDSDLFNRWDAAQQYGVSQTFGFALSGIGDFARIERAVF